MGDCGCTTVRYMITVSHETAWWYRFRLGTVFRTKETPKTQQDFDVDKIIVHHGYLDHYVVNDIALVKLAERAVFTEAVRPVCLPDSSFPLPYNKFTNLKCWATGWGSIEPRGGRKWIENLQGVAMPLVSRWGTLNDFHLESSDHRCEARSKRLHIAPWMDQQKKKTGKIVINFS